MPATRVFIVDDQREVSNMLRASLESLSAEFDISEFLSGEEALLDAKEGQVDLLISDVILPGINGLELMEKFRQRNERLKVILVSGVADTKIRQQVAQAGADAFFFKPIELADFLDAVERSLGLVETLLPNELEAQKEPIQQELKQQAKGLADRVAGLRQEIKAAAIFLVSDWGKVLVRAGELPDSTLEDNLIPSMMTVFNAGVRISYMINAEFPQSHSYYRGRDFDLFLSPVGNAYALLIATPSGESVKFADIAESLKNTVLDISEILTDIGVSLNIDAASFQEHRARVEHVVTGSLVDPDLDNLLHQAEDTKPKKEEVDAFWESSHQTPSPSKALSGDALSYDQAQQLGLAPDDELDE
jgi:FixJ family two-component response regulator